MFVWRMDGITDLDQSPLEWFCFLVHLQKETTIGILPPLRCGIGVLPKVAS